MSDYYDGYREGMAQASRETAALREQLDAMLKSVADLKSLTMPPPSINLTIPSARKPMTEDEIDESVGKASNFDFSTDFYDGFFAGIRYAEKHHKIGDSNE